MAYNGEGRKDKHCTTLYANGARITAAAAAKPGR